MFLLQFCISSKSQLKLIICLNYLGMNFVIIAPGIGPGAHKHMPNGILGLLCKLQFPGLMEISGMEQPTSSLEHYIAAEDVQHRRKASRVLAELWVSVYACFFCKLSIDRNHHTLFEVLTSCICVGFLQIGGGSTASVVTVRWQGRSMGRISIRLRSRLI